MRNFIVYTVHLINLAKLIKSRRLRCTGHVARMEEGRSAFKILTHTSRGKIPLGRHRWEDNIRMDLKEICISTRNWVDSAQDTDYRRALVNVTLNLRVNSLGVSSRSCTSSIHLQRMMGVRVTTRVCK